MVREDFFDGPVPLEGSFVAQGCDLSCHIAMDILTCCNVPCASRHVPSAVPPQALCQSPRTDNALPRQAFGLTSGKGGLVSLGCWTANSSFWSGQLPCPTSSDRRRPSTSQHRRPRRARWSFPSYSPESLSGRSTLGSGNLRQISFPVPPKGCFVVRQGDSPSPVPPKSCSVARQVDKNSGPPQVLCRSAFRGEIFASRPVLLSEK